MGFPTPLPPRRRLVAPRAEAPTDVLAAALDWTGELLWFMAGTETGLLQDVVDAIDTPIATVWSVLHAGLEAVQSLATQTANALGAFWTLVLEPIWTRLWDVLQRVYLVVTNSLGPALQAARVLADQVTAVLTSSVGSLVTELVQLVDAVAVAHTAAVTTAAATDAMGGALGQLASSGFGRVVDHLNGAALWINHLAHPTGVIREDPYVYSWAVYLGDCLGYAINVLIPDDLAALLAGAAQHWPVPTYQAQLQGFTTQAALQLDSVRRALAAFTGTATSASP